MKLNELIKKAESLDGSELFSEEEEEEDMMLVKLLVIMNKVSQPPQTVDELKSSCSIRLIQPAAEGTTQKSFCCSQTLQHTHTTKTCVLYYYL